MTNYFVSRLASDGSPTNNFKDLNSHAFPLFKSGHIQSIFVAMQQPDKYMIRCRCLPEMKKDIVYKIDLTIDAKGDIITAMCGCPAGVGPSGCCKHISALCYALEEFCRIKELRSPQSCTAELQRWNQPRKRKLDCRNVEDISFVKYEYKKEKKAPQSLVYDPRPPSLRSTSEASLHTLKEDLQKTGKDVVLLHLLPGPSSSETTSSPSTLPSTPPIVHQDLLKQLQSLPQPLNITDISTSGLKLVEHPTTNIKC